MIPNRDLIVNTLATTLNINGVDTEVGIPDFILAEAMVAGLELMAKTHRDNEVWHGRATTEATVEALFENEELLINVLDPQEDLPHNDDGRLMVDSDGNGPPRPPKAGMVWVLDHAACDQGHYGISTWKEVEDEE